MAKKIYLVTYILVTVDEYHRLTDSCNDVACYAVFITKGLATSAILPCHSKATYDDRIRFDVFRW